MLNVSSLSILYESHSEFNLKHYIPHNLQHEKGSDALNSWAFKLGHNALKLFPAFADHGVKVL